MSAGAVPVRASESGARHVVVTEQGCRAALHPPTMNAGDIGSDPEDPEFALAIGAALLPRWHHASRRVDGGADRRSGACFDVELAASAAADVGATQAWVTSFTHASDREIFATLRVGTGQAASDAIFLGLLHWTDDGHVIADALVPSRCTDSAAEMSAHEVSGHRLYAFAGGTFDDDTPRTQVGLYRREGHAFARVGVFPTGLVFGRDRVFVPQTAVTEAPGGSAQPALLRDWNVSETVDQFTFDGQALTARASPAVTASAAAATPGPASLGPQPVRAVDVAARGVVESADGCSTALHLTPGDEAANARELLAAAGTVLLPAASWRGARLRTQHGRMRGCGGAAFGVRDTPDAPQVTVVPHLHDHRLFAIVDVADVGGGACEDHAGVMGILRWTDDGRVTTEAVSPWSNRCQTSLRVVEHVVGGRSLYEVPGGTFGTGGGLTGDVSLYRIDGHHLARVRSFTTYDTHDQMDFPETIGSVFFSGVGIFHARSIVDDLHAGPNATPPAPPFWRALHISEVVDTYASDGRTISAVP